MLYEEQMYERSPVNFLFRIILSIIVLGCIILIIFLSLLPPQEMPHTGIPKGVDHFIAYWGTGGLMALAFSARRHFVVAGGIGLITLAGTMESLQYFSPGRTPMLSDFFLSSGGALLGLAMGVITFRCLRLFRD